MDDINQPRCLDPNASLRLCSAAPVSQNICTKLLLRICDSFCLKGSESHGSWEHLSAEEIELGRERKLKTHQCNNTEETIIVGLENGFHLCWRNISLSLKQWVTQFMVPNHQLICIHLHPPPPYSLLLLCSRRASSFHCYLWVAPLHFLIKDWRVRRASIQSKSAGSVIELFRQFFCLRQKEKLLLLRDRLVLSFGGASWGSREKNGSVMFPPPSSAVFTAASARRQTDFK